MLKVKIYYHHTDCGGVVYYANYLKFLEEARTEFLLEKGVSIKDLSKSGVLFAVIRQEIDYKSPAFYADTLNIDTRISNTSKVKIEFEHQIKNQQDKIICQARTLLACVDANFKPLPIPEEIRNKIVSG